MIKVIAEVGVNHNGDKDLALQLIRCAHEAGADIVKFQTFKADKIATKRASLAKYQSENTGRTETQQEMLRRLELDYEAYLELFGYCKELGIEFLSTAFDLESLRFLVGEIGLTTLKIPSGEITNAPFILAHARTNCDLIVSTGMASLAEIEMALGVIAFGLVAPSDSAPSKEAFSMAYASTAGQNALRSKVTLLHCTSEYPAPLQEVNLRAMKTLASAFELAVGYSDHSKGITVPIAAAVMGATVLEKHFTLDRRMEGPDHQASLEPLELQEMVRAIRDVELALGSSVKTPQPSEINNRAVARRSLVASRTIKAGEAFSENNIDVRRPGTGLSPYHYWSLLGQKASQDYCEGDLLNE